MEEQQKHLERWIRQHKQIARDEGDLVFLELTHLGQTRHEKLWSSPVDIDSDPEDLASAAYQAAYDDATGLGGIQRYSLATFFGTEKKKKIGEKKRFRIRGPEDEDFPEDIGSEVANAKGLVTQSMRHSEALMRTTVGSAQDIIRHYQKMVDSFGMENERLRVKLAEMYDAHEEILSLQNEREIERMQAEKKEERFDELIRMVKLLGPGIVNKLAGKKILEEKESPEAFQLREFMESLTQEQLQQLGGVLKPAQLGVVLQLADKYLKEEQEAKNNGKALPAKT